MAAKGTHKVEVVNGTRDEIQHPGHSSQAGVHCDSVQDTVAAQELVVNSHGDQSRR